MLKLFGDEDAGGLYFYSSISEKLILKPKDIYDGAIPSGNGIALLNLSTLYKITKDENIYNKYKSILKKFWWRYKSKSRSSYIFYFIFIIFIDKCNLLAYNKLIYNNLRL